MCSKIPYATKAEAERAIWSIKLKVWRGYPRHKECRSYYCTKCGQWHLTSRGIPSVTYCNG